MAEPSIKPFMRLKKICLKINRLDYETQFLKGDNGAQEKTRTSTPLRVLAPEASASTNSATWAQGDGLSANLLHVN